LKNSQNVLPLPSSAKILVTGPNANSMRTLNGGWTYTWQGDRTDEIAGQYNTILEAVTKKFRQENVRFSEGVAYKMKEKYWADSIVNIQAAVDAAANVDYIVLCLGENSYTETPGNLNELNLSENQLALARAMISTGKRVILVLNEGRPRIISSIEPGVATIVHTYLPGNYGADALADILAGDVNPSGKLPITYPRYANSLTPYIHKYSDQIANPQGAYDYSADFNPQFPFGYGLSYTTFEYSNLKLGQSTVDPNGTLNISVTVKNTGARAGKEVVQVFVSDLLASLTPDVKRLRRFEKIELQPGASQTVNFTLPVRELAFVNLQNKKQLEAGEFKVLIGNLTSNFTMSKTVTF
jgi:beta-glucosidase